jgi:Zn-dependent protease with chaperone function
MAAVKNPCNPLVIFLFAAIASLGLGGCSAAPRWSEWSKAEGGILHDSARQARAETALGKLVGPRTPVFIHVLDNGNVTAYSYADGHVFVTRGLVDAATDDELAAAIAHELGHLVSDGHLRGSAYRGFTGPEDPDDKEMQADAVGMRLMTAAGCKPTAMVTILQKVSAASRSPGIRSAIAERVLKLRDGMRTAAAKGPAKS